MYTLFETSNPNKTPRFFYMGFESIRRRWLENIVRLQGHWRYSGYAVPSDHILSRLVGGFSIPLYDDVRKYRDAIVDMVPRLCMACSIAAPTNSTYNLDNPGWFYGLKGKEYLISDSTSFDPVQAAANWESLEPMKVIRHTLTDLNMPFPNGDVPDVADGYVIISINIPMLAVQYWCWQRSQRVTTQGAAEKTTQFIGQYILPSLLASQTTVAFFNRMLAMFTGSDVTGERKVNSLALSTNYTGVDRLIDQMLLDFRANKMTFAELFGCIPTTTAETYLAFMQPPDTIVARQNQWALEAAFIPYVSFAMQLSKLHDDNAQNQLERNFVNRMVRRIVSDRLFDAAPRAIRNDLRLDFDTQVAIWAQ